MNPNDASATSPLGGIKILDFSVSIAGPVLSSYMGNFGAEVIKVETQLKPDILRLSTPCKDGISGVDRSGLFNYMSCSKLSMALDMSHPRKDEVTSRLVKWADVLIENTTVGVKERWGLDYPSVCQINPSIIMVSTTSQGQTGPHCTHPGWGWSMKSLCGFTHFTGWPDRDGTAPAPSYTDEVSPWFAISTILAALDHKRRTGEGQYIDHSQVEASLHFLTDALLDYTANGHLQTRVGNCSPRACPHGCYRCQGEDRWCVIAVSTDQEWRALCQIIGNPEWSTDPKFASMKDRQQSEVELDRLIEAWTIHLSPEQVMEKLQSAGVAAGIVQDEEDILDRDPHLKARGYFPEVTHPVMGQERVMGFPFELSAYTPETRPAPCLGEHTEKVCTDLLGISIEEFVDLLQSGVFT